MSIRRALSALPLVVLLLSGTSAVRAQKPPAPSASDAAKQKAAQTQFDQGLAALKAKNYDASQKAFEAVIAAYPRMVPAYVNLGMVYRLKGDRVHEEETLRKAVALGPKDAFAIRALADTYLSQKKWAEAAPLLRRMAVLAPKDAGVRAALGQTELTLNHVDAAESQFRAAERLRPDFLPVLQTLAGIYASKNKTADLTRTLVAIQRLQPKDAKAAFTLGMLYARSNQPKLALVQFKRAAALDPNNTVAATNVARVQLQLGQAKQAEAVFAKILKEHPNDPEAHFALGVADYNQKRFASAVKHFRAVLANPKSGKSLGARLNLAGALSNLSDYKGAAAEYEEAIKIEPKNKQAYNMLAFVYQRMGKNEEATNAYKRLLLIDPTDTNALQSVAIAAQIGGKPDEAVPYYERMLKLRPGDRIATEMLASIYAGQKQADKAVALYQPMLKKDKRVHAQIARIFNQAGMKDKAIEEMKTWTKEQPKSREAWLGLGDLYRDQSNFPDAYTAYDATKKVGEPSSAAYVQKAQLYQQQQKMEDALKELAASPKNAKDAEQAYQLAGTILEGQQKKSEAVAQYRLAAKANPKNPMYRQNVARVLLDDNQTVEAIKEYQALAKSYPKDGYVQSGLAKALEKKGDKSAAIAAWRRSGELNKFDNTWVTNIARLQDEMGQGAQAVKTLIAAYAKQPGDSIISAQLIALAEKHDKLDDAIAALNKPAEKNSPIASVYSVLSNAYSRKDQKLAPTAQPGPEATATGIEVFRNYLQRFPKNEGVAGALASYAGMRGHWADVVTADRALLAARPADNNLRLQLGDALEKVKNYKGAEAQYRAVLEKDKSNSRAHLALAKVLESQSQIIAARAEYEEVQRIEPTNPEALQALARLKAPVGATPQQPTPPTLPPGAPVGLTPPVG